MTQAPTPGPLSGDFSVEEYVADYEFRAEEGSYSPTENERALLIDAIHGALSEASLSLAPTAPVEASGSEREWLISVMRDHIELGEIGSCSAEIVGHEEAADAILALRAQPSGETRARFRHKKRGTFYTLVGGARLQCANPLPDMSEIVVYRGDDGDLWARSNIEFWDGRFECVSVGTTPARAEAQDERAAGYKAALIDDLRRYYNDCTPPQMEYAQSDGLAFALDTAIRLLSEVHPSPTPAADDDRVREAMRELIDADKELAVAINFAEPTENNDALTTAEYRAQAARNQAEQALAALKSTAAKEGGAK